MLNCYLYQIAEPVGKLRRPEKLLYLTWLRQDFPQNNLKTVDGTDLSILAAGRRNLLEGPDFKEAQIVLGKNVLKGAIEIHWKSSDWYTHNHEQDPTYDEVILHVVAQHDLKNPIRTSSGRILPTFILKHLTEAQPAEWPCASWPKVEEEHFEKTLRRFYEQRWQRKCQNWHTAIAAHGAEQAFYLGWLDVLGYSQNRLAFQQLGQILPLEKLYYLIEQAGDEPIPLIEAVLCGTAGFLDYQLPPGFRTDTVYFKTLQKDWHRMQSEYGLRVGKDLPWHFAGIRPANYPHKRLTALAQTLVKVFPHYPGQIFLRKLRMASDFQAFYGWAAELLQQPEGLWKNHPLLSKQRGNVLVGTERLNDFLTNLVLPYSRAIGIIENDAGLMERASLWAEKIPNGELPYAVKQLLYRLKLDLKKMKYNWMIQGAIEYLQCYCELHLCSLCQLEVQVVR